MLRFSISSVFEGNASSAGAFSLPWRFPCWGACNHFLKGKASPGVASMHNAINDADVFIWLGAPETEFCMKRLLAFDMLADENILKRSLSSLADLYGQPIRLTNEETLLTGA
jgi:hypothetical protein